MLKKIIVTGGLGFIGSNLVKLLIKKKYYVVNLDKVSYASSFYNLKNINKKYYKFYKGDICNNKLIKRLLKKHKPIALFNLAEVYRNSVESCSESESTIEDKYHVKR